MFWGARRGLVRAELLWIFLRLGHASDPFGSGSGQVAQIWYSPNWNQPGVLPQAVTTVWRTELGTTLWIGFNSTTVVTAYFRYLSIRYSLPNRRAPPSSSPVWPRPAGPWLWRNFAQNPQRVNYLRRETVSEWFRRSRRTLFAPQ